MRVANSKNHKVFKVEDKGKVVLLNIGDSRKTPTGYDNFYWQAICVANGAVQARGLKKGDIIEIKEGIAFIETYKEKVYNKVTVFGLEIQERASDNEDPFVNEHEYLDPPPEEEGYDSGVGPSPF